MRISLTRRAERNYRSIKDHIENEWGEGVAEAFERKTINFLDLLDAGKLYSDTFAPPLKGVGGM